MFFTLPTLLTWARIVAIPLIVGVFYLPLDAATRNLVATVMFVVAPLNQLKVGGVHSSTVSQGENHGRSATSRAQNASGSASASRCSRWSSVSSMA